ncbi:hydantoinase/oxoprolinase family protein [Neorhizobium sp. Rsf11]|uniref:Hydantoinase/oxoprolinase family protein n=2 Tax=Neorhizobium TaxID=1525371 RepID=A0ABV0M6D0_9HYPH|nr:hydantoinase/oxoprolinase family protein [Neorhizobium petrolearium]MCC2611736.1 hydantoinase/oxoprolinase family protein [Neorhizobium petrolearium]WGI66907.1 hydantoinase/oxoprolinase family protein [Neorhizobium petrolearium]
MSSLEMSVDTSLSVAVDIGGTFTDVALLDRATGKVWRAKTPSVPSDPSEAFLNGIRLALADAGREAASLGQVLHGTTVATNMILEDKGARTALVTTRGFRHVLAIGRQDIPRKANLYTWVKPERPVPASRIVEIDERIGAGGAILDALDEASVRTAADAIRGMDVEAVGVCLLHAFANPVHEKRAAEILREELPNLAVTTSTDVLPVVREFERTLTTVLNATVMPGVTTYVGRLEKRLTDEKVAAPLLLMQSNGGVAGAATIRQAPALTALSGPAAGVVGARSVAAACGIKDIITVDIGGTSADICLIKDGRIGLTQNGKVGEWPLPLPMVDMVTIGAGGGSIAKVSDHTLSVGPQSAGARPGPAAYGHGGENPTVTDAHVVLGHLPARLLGGRMALDVEAARKAVDDKVAGPLGLSTATAARGILAIVDNHMVGAVRVVSVERGHDPRDFTLVPFGGAGPLHGCSLAELLGISRVMIAPAPGILCADGLLAADLKAEFSRTLPRAGAVDMDVANGIISDLKDQAIAWFEAEGVAEKDRRIQTVALLRYHGQGGELAVAWGESREAVEAAFAAEHKALYGFTLDTSIELVTLRVEAAGMTHEPPPARLEAGSAVTPFGHVPVHFESGVASVPVVDRATLGAGATFKGPMILTQLDTTTLVAPGWTGTVHPSGALLLTARQDA